MNERSNKPLIHVLHGNILKVPPIWLMRQAGRYLPEYKEIRRKTNSFLTLCYTPELAAEVTLQPIRRFGFDAAIIFSDILVVPHALGKKLQYIDGKGPVLEPIISKKHIQDLRVENIEEFLDPVFQAVRLVKKSLPDMVSLIGFAGAPWTVATYMIEGGTSWDFRKVKKFSLDENKAFHLLIDILVNATVRYLKQQIQAGAEVIQLFDSWAGVLSGEQFVEWVIMPTRSIVMELKKTYPKVPIIGFPKGAGVNMLRYIKETGVNAIGIDYTVSCEWAHKAFEKKIPIQGNLSPRLLAENSEGAVREIRSITKCFSDRPHIVNLGHGILPETPIENVHAMINAVRQKSE